MEHILQIGTGIVGKANIKGYKHYGFPVIALDVIPEIIKNINKEGIDCRHINDNLNDLVDISIILISVPTPLNKKKKRLSMDYVWSTINTVVKLIKISKKEIIIVMRSTVYPGLTREYEKFLQKYTNKKFYIAFQPEFLRAVTAEKDALYPWKVLFGYKKEDENVKNRMKNILLKFVNNNEKHIRIMSLEEAEIHKCVHNYANGMRISFANSIYGLINNINEKHNFNIDAQHVLNNVSCTAESFLNPKYGIRVGAPYGGVCLPKDCPELINMAVDYNVDTRISDFLNGTEEVNKWITENKGIQIKMDESPNLMSYNDLKK